MSTLAAERRCDPGNPPDADPPDPVTPECPDCPGPVELSQPDPENPSALLMVCLGCRAWFRLDLDPDPDLDTAGGSIRRIPAD